MPGEYTKEQIQHIVAALNEAINEGPWDKSNFLRLIGKNLSQIRDDLSSYIDVNAQQTSAHQNNQLAVQVRPLQTVYIALYSNEGTHLAAWEKIINTLPKYVLSRPVYAQEKDARNFIKSKNHPNNEGYVALTIQQDDILPLTEEKTPKDKLGKALLSLKDGAVKLENIQRFVHVSGQYQYSKGRLSKNNTATF